MEFTIGTFEAENKTCSIPKKSLVRVQFPKQNVQPLYYNDQFDLKMGDFVHVEGKMAGQLGRVTEVNYNFKIKPSDYWKVTALVDTCVRGQFYMAGSHFVTFDPAALTPRQIITWFKASTQEDEEFVISTDDSSFSLDNLNAMNISAAIAERGHDYYLENRVRYLCLDGAKGFAIVEGTETYTVEFEYHNGQISHLLCDCPCGYTCKHEFAAMLQLNETLELIDKHYAEEYARSNYFAAVLKSTLFTFAIAGKETGSFIL